MAALLGDYHLAGAELFEDVGAVWSNGGLDDVVLLGAPLGGVPELGCGVLGAGLLVDEDGDGPAERVGVARSRPVSVRARRTF